MKFSEILNDIDDKQNDCITTDSPLIHSMANEFYVIDAKLNAFPLLNKKIKLFITLILT